MVDNVRHRVDQFDDQLGHEIPGRRLPAEDDGARRHVKVPVLLEPVVEGDHVKHVQVLALVLVKRLT